MWSFRRHWRDEKSRIQADLLAGGFRFGLLDRITLKAGSDIDLWSARDALVSTCGACSSTGDTTRAATS